MSTGLCQNQDTQTHAHDIYIIKHVHTKSIIKIYSVFPLQGNQMTLVFMEREYSSPEEPHLGIVHMVEVKIYMRS